MGTNTSVGLNPVILAGPTPITVYVFPFNVMLFPRTSADNPNLRFHSPSLMIATGVPPAWSSSVRKFLPSGSWTPSAVKKSAEIMWPWSRSGSPTPVMLYSSLRAAPSAENEWLSFCQSRKFG